MKSTNLLSVMFALAAFAIATADTADAGLFGRMRGGCCQTSCCDSGFLSGLRDRGNDCCYETTCCEPAPCGCEGEVVVEDCGCAEAAPCCETQCCDSGMGSRLKARLTSLRGNNCCCEPATECGCEEEVVVEIATEG